MNKGENETKNEFYTLAKDIFTNNESQDIFETLWIKEEYRQAYLIYHEAKENSQQSLDKQQEKIDKEFYWIFVN